MVLDKAMNDPQVRRVFEIATHKVEYVDELTAVRDRHLSVRNAFEGNLARALELAADHLVRGRSPREFACALGQVDGITGYIHHTVPVALYCWLCAPRDVRAVVEGAVRLGGDTDTVAAIAGALAGAAAESVPESWLRGLWERPRSARWMERLAARLTATFVDQPRARPGPLPLFWPALLLRNLVFTVIVLGHGFARLWPARLRAGTGAAD